MIPLSKTACALALLLAATAFVLPAASAADICAPSTAVGSACVHHSPYSGSLYCEKAWSSGGGSEAVSVVLLNGLAHVWAYEGYWCFNWSNYGENPYQSSSIVLGTGAAGYSAYVGFGSYYETYYTDTGGPFYREGCYVWYSVYGSGVNQWRFVDCPPTPAPWGTLLTPAFQNYVSLNADCTSGSAPTVQVCWRGDTTGYYAGFSACDGARNTEAKVLGTRTESWTVGIAGCLVFRDLLG